MIACRRALHRRLLRHAGQQPPSSSDVVQLYRSKGINGMRIYSPNANALNALRNSGIVLVLDTGNGDELSRLAGSASYVASWVQSNVKPYYPAVNIKYIAVGNETVIRLRCLRSRISLHRSDLVLEKFRCPRLPLFSTKILISEKPDLRNRHKQPRPEYEIKDIDIQNIVGCL
ncbi:unnamed protein product [Miscanthus lutarioriparius]|uniref:Glucan endo-1,3-beta-D-glucosidase n=1 Tax=Miscanthus lutarioriparius TaxID=422564 RepID=A0A811Q102_9POAL|nr:unnamed protein product [Miscanthus lutarioriparius]